NLADLTDFPFESIPGIGRTKGDDLRKAVRNLTHEARSRFEAGACPEAQDLRRRLAALEADRRARELARGRELAAVDATLVETDALAEAARHVTFWNYLFRPNT